MHVSAKSEARMADAMGKEIEREFGQSMLPANHPLTVHVTDIVRRIVRASNLGHVKGDEPPDDGFGGGSGMSTGVIEHADPRLRVDVGGPSQQDSPAAQQREWTVHVVQSKVPNAFTTFGAWYACPEAFDRLTGLGGHVVVFTGILPVCENDDGLAAVLGHGMLNPKVLMPHLTCSPC
jgi:metalloendopeptidase OMA1, mitochondrial